MYVTTSLYKDLYRANPGLEGAMGPTLQVMPQTFSIKKSIWIDIWKIMASNYASPSSEVAYSDRQLTPNFEL